jgi:uncharacterized protein
VLIVYVDADACPVKEEVYRVAARYQVRVAVVAKAPLRVPVGGRVELVVRPGFGADDWIAEQAGPGDVVVTADKPVGPDGNGGLIQTPLGWRRKGRPSG